jgi:LysM repeat protein
MKRHLFVVLALATLLLAGFPLARDVYASCDPIRHVVRPGENLTQIALRYGTSVSAIVQANRLWNPNLIYTGQVLLIPVSCVSPPAPTSCTTIHVVKRGEYLKTIAIRYGTTVTAIVQLNNIRNPNLIYSGQRLKIPVKCPGPTPQPTSPSPTKPWKAQYWDNKLLSGDPEFTVYETIVDHNWGTSGPGKSVAGTTFSARWNRIRYFDAGQYRFNVKVDDGVRVWLDGILIIDQWHDSAPQTYSVVKQVSSGDHNLQIDYYQNQGTAQIKFWIDSLGPQAVWKGEFYNNTNLQDPLVATRYYEALDNGWGKNSPATGVTADYFSARFTGEFEFVGGTYQFIATVDDGVRIYLDDNLIMDQWHETSAVTYRVDVDVAEGTHKIRVEYFEGQGAAVCKVRWTQK